MTWTFIWLMLLLKIPIGGLLWIVWWAIHQTESDPVGDDGDGGSKVHPHRTPRPRPPRPRPRRGAHATLPPPAPSRIRANTVRVRALDCAAAQRQPQRCAHSVTAGTPAALAAGPGSASAEQIA